MFPTHFPQSKPAPAPPAALLVVGALAAGLIELDDAGKLRATERGELLAQSVSPPVPRALRLIALD